MRKLGKNQQWVLSRFKFFERYPAKGVAPSAWLDGLLEGLARRGLIVACGDPDAARTVYRLTPAGAVELDQAAAGEILAAAGGVLPSAINPTIRQVGHILDSKLSKLVKAIDVDAWNEGVLASAANGGPANFLTAASAAVAFIDARRAELGELADSSALRSWIVERWLAGFHADRADRHRTSALATLQ